MLTIHQSQLYEAFVHPTAGLIVQSKRKTGGVNMRPDHPQYNDWVEAFTTAIDAVEADDLCKALLA